MTVDQTNDPVIAAARERIDQIDAALIDLLRRRREASATVQRAREKLGGTRLDRDREDQIIRRYEDAFREPGHDLGRLILEVCRGQPGELA